MKHKRKKNVGVLYLNAYFTKKPDDTESQIWNGYKEHISNFKRKVFEVNINIINSIEPTMPVTSEINVNEWKYGR